MLLSHLRPSSPPPRTLPRFLSHQWKPRRDSDVYADRAIAEGLRSRAAYKLLEIDRRHGRFLRQGANVVDLGAAPGGFAMVAAARVALDVHADRWDLPKRFPSDAREQEVARTAGGGQRRRKFGNLVCVDMQDMEPIPGAQFIHGDFTDPSTREKVVYALRGREADVVLSDMSPSTTGDKGLNHDRILMLAEEAAAMARSLLRNGGVFVCKLFNGKDEEHFRSALREDFVKVKAVKPAASRKTSPEIFYVATGFVPAHMKEPMPLSDDSVELVSADEMVRDLERMKRKRKARRA